MTTTELVPRASSAADSLALVAPAFELAQRIARTDFVPTALRNKPEAVLACILTGNEVGIGPMQALAKIHVIEGRPAMAAELMRALVLRDGHDIWIEESTTTKCTVAGKRYNSERETRVTFTLDDAKRAGLDGRKNWRSFPQAMLLARASAALIRAIFPDVVAGLGYALEEVQDGFIDADLVDIDEPDAPPAKPRRTRKATKTIARQAAPVAGAAGPADVPPLPGEEGALVGDDANTYEGPDEELTGADAGPTMPWPQWAGMKATEVGITDDAHRHGLWKAVTAGRVERAADLTDEEKSNARAALEELRLGTAALGTGGPGAYALIGKKDGLIRRSSYWVEAGDTFDLIAPPAHAGKTFTVQGQEAATSPPDRPESPPSASAADPAPASTPTPPAAATGDTAGDDFSTGDAWRAWLRERKLKVADAIRAASEVAVELRVGDANVPRSLTDLAEAGVGFGAAVRQRLTQ